MIINSIPPVYDDVLDAADGYAVVVTNNKAGVINFQQEVVVPFIYDPSPDGWRQPNETSRGIAALQQGPKQMFLFHLKSGRKINELPFQEVHFKQYDHYRGVILVKQQDQYGLLDYEGQWILPVSFDSLWPCDTGHVAIGRHFGQIAGNLPYYTGIKNGKAGLYKTDGQQVLKHEFEHLTVIQVDGISCFAVKKQVSDEPMEVWGDFYNPENRKYETMQKWIPTEKWGLIGLNGETILPCAYDNILYAGFGRFVVLVHAIQYVWQGNKRQEYFKQDGESFDKIRYGIVASDGRIISTPTLTGVGLRYNYDGYMAVNTADGWSSIDLEGRIGKSPSDLLSDKYDRVISLFYEGKAVVSKKKDLIIIDQAGQELFVFKDTTAESINDHSLLLVKGYNAAKNARLMGVLNIQTGNYLINTEYKAIDTSALPESGVFIVTNSEGKKGYIDASGKMLTACKYAEANPFYENKALVKADGKYGFIDREGQEIVPPELKSATHWRGNATIITIGKKKGVLSC